MQTAPPHSIGLRGCCKPPTGLPRPNRRALAVAEQMVGPDQRGVAIANNPALLLKASNRLTEAEALYRRALTIDKKS